MLQATPTTNSAVTALEETLARTSTELEEKIDKLEGFSRRDNLKFFNIPQAADEDYDTCAMKAVDILRGTVPNKQWCRDDIVRAHRLGNNNNNNNNNNRNSNGPTKSQPIIAKFTRWSDKMDVLTKGREELKKKGITVTGDLTPKQQNTTQEHHDRGLTSLLQRQQTAGGRTSPVSSPQPWQLRRCRTTWSQP